MTLIPEEELKKAASLNLAPLVDFLFVIVAVFATMSITRAVLYDTQVNLVKVNSEKKTSITEQPFVVNIGITEDGKYKWITEVNEFMMGTTGSIQKELQKQQQLGLISKNPEHTKILLHIDKNAKWEPVAQAIFALREQGFPVHPVYEPLDP
jgi:biopolymer transport protein ExbD